jgi:hypothetical protein
MMKYIHFGRGFGHTEAMLNGARNTPGVAIVAHNRRFAEYLAKQCPDAIPISISNLERLRGIQCPILIDNCALEHLQMEWKESIDKMASDLAEANVCRNNQARRLATYENTWFYRIWRRFNRQTFDE